MTPQIPEYLLAFESSLRPAVLAIALGLVWTGAFRMEAPAGVRYTAAVVLSVALVAWLAIADYVGAHNFYFAGTPQTVPTILLGLGIPTVGAALVISTSDRLRTLVNAIPLQWLVAAQVYRIGGGIFLVLWLDGRLPWQFALPAGIGDVATGLAALPIAIKMEQNTAGSDRAAYLWCLFGITDLVIAIMMGALTSPGLPHLVAFDAPNLLITSYPLVMVPTFAVPLALVMHGLVLWRLRRQVVSNPGLATA